MLGVPNCYLDVAFIYGYIILLLVALDLVLNIGLEVFFGVEILLQQLLVLL
jgi:hypothetical protein